MIAINQQIREDVSTLLNRAFLDEYLTVFGADGLGKHGKSDHPKTFRIDEIHVNIDLNADGITSPMGIVFLTLKGYDSSDCGHIATDKNAEIGIAKLLQPHSIDPAALTWAELIDQGDDYIAFFIDVPRLLQWA